MSRGDLAPDENSHETRVGTRLLAIRTAVISVTAAMSGRRLIEKLMCDDVGALACHRDCDDMEPQLTVPVLYTLAHEVPRQTIYSSWHSTRPL